MINAAQFVYEAQANPKQTIKAPPVSVVLAATCPIPQIYGVDITDNSSSACWIRDSFLGD
jgi:hypothetical protein